MGIGCLHCCEVDAPELGRTPGELNRIAESDGPQEPARRLGSSRHPADAVREQGWMQGAALGDEQAGRCNRRTGGGSSCPPRQEVLDRLSLLPCSRELLGQVTGCVAEEASLGYRNLEEPTLSASLCQPDTARGGAPGPQVWTSHDPETVP